MEGLLARGRGMADIARHLTKSLGGAFYKMMKRPAESLILFCFLALSVARVGAHPHQFIDLYMTLVFDCGGFVGIEAEWHFTKQFAQVLAWGYDKNEDCIFDEEETASLYNGDFSTFLRDKLYFHLRLQDDVFTVATIENFKAWIYLDEVEVSFFMPCSIPALPGGTYFEWATYDETIFNSFDLVMLRIKNDPTLIPKLEYRLDSNLCSHSPDKCGVWVLVAMPPPGDGDAAAGVSSQASNLVPYNPVSLGGSPAPTVNPFTGR